MSFTVLPLDFLVVPAPSSILYILDLDAPKTTTVAQGIVEIVTENEWIPLPYSSLHPSLVLKGQEARTAVFVPEWICIKYSIKPYDGICLEYIEGSTVPATSVKLRALSKCLARSFSSKLIKGVVLKEGMSLSLTFGGLETFFVVDEIQSQEQGELFECTEKTEIIFDAQSNKVCEDSDILSTIYEHDVKNFMLNVEASHMNLGSISSSQCSTVYVLCASEERSLVPFCEALVKTTGTAILQLDLYGFTEDDDIEWPEDRTERLIETVLRQCDNQPTIFHVKNPGRFTVSESIKRVCDLLVRIQRSIPTASFLFTDVESPKSLLSMLGRQSDFKTIEFAPSPLSHAGRKSYLTHYLKDLDPTVESIVDEFQWKLNGLDIADLDTIVEEIKAHLSPSTTVFDCFRDALESVSSASRPDYIRLVPRGQCSWDDISGYEEQIQKIKNMLYGPWKQKELYSKFGIVKSPGMLFHGPSGCGKSSVVQAIANDGTFSVLEVDLSELKSKYLGETEERLRHAFSIARQNAPCVLFIDEIDALGKRRGVSGGESGSGGAEERLLSTLLNEMDGIEDLGAVTIIGCTNRIDAIDSALKRPGRLDLHVHFDYPTIEDRTLLIRSTVKKMNINDADDEQVSKLAGLTDSMSSAEIVQIFQEAGRLAISRSSDSPKINLQDVFDVV